MSRLGIYTTHIRWLHHEVPISRLSCLRHVIRAPQGITPDSPILWLHQWMTCSSRNLLTGCYFGKPFEYALRYHTVVIHLLHKGFMIKKTVSKKTSSPDVWLIQCSGVVSQWLQMVPLAAKEWFPEQMVDYYM